MKRVFIETELFKALVDDEVENGLEKRVKDLILTDPLKGAVIQGAGGLRKIRVSKVGSGKSGGYRVIYLDLEKHEVTYLVLIYGKSVQDNLTGEQKRLLKKQVEEIKNEYKKKSNK